MTGLLLLSRAKLKGHEEGRGEDEDESEDEEGMREDQENFRVCVRNRRVFQPNLLTHISIPAHHLRANRVPFLLGAHVEASAMMDVCGIYGADAT